MIGRYFNFTVLVGTLRAAAIMSTEGYRKTNEYPLVVDSGVKCVVNGVCTPVLWPLLVYADARNLEIYLRKEEYSRHRIDHLLFW